jgi:ribose transport system substrate-binding protein
VFKARPGPGWGRFAVAAVALLSALTIAACGSSSSSSSSASATSSAGTSAASASGGATPAFLTQAKAVLAKGYAGDYQPPPTSGPKAVKGKNVWYISCGQAYQACVVQGDGFKDAAASLGWKVSLQDGKADPTTAAAIIRQAIAAKVDGIVVAYFDCPGIKSSLLAAQAAKIPVVSLGSVDCNSPIYGGNGPALFAAAPKLMGSSDPASYYEKWAKARADYVIATTNGKANVLSIYENSQAIQQANGKAFADEMATCTTCTVKRVAFTFAQTPNPFTQDIKSAILADPKATIIGNGIDALMLLGLQPAVQQSGRKLDIDGAELNPANIGLIKSGVQHSAAAVPYGWFAYAAADTLNRIFAGEKPTTFPNEGSGWQFVDKTHNLPTGSVYNPSVDYRAAYEKIWGS